MNPIDFVATIAPHAVDDYMRSGVLASITIAQGALESAWGRSAPGNNLFGIKGEGSLQETKEFLGGQWVMLTDGFRVYDNWLGSINDHSKFLRENGRYAKAGFFDCCKAMDYRGAAQALHAAGYATDPSYSDLLIGIIEEHKLYQFDGEGKKKMEELIARVAALEAKVQVLEKTGAPDWFITEFGDASIGGIIKDATGDADFWRNTAVTMRVIDAHVEAEPTIAEPTIAPVETKE